jgi:hypothetical protein
MAYVVGQTIEVCLEFDLPLAQGVRLVVATFVNEHGEVAELTNMPARGVGVLLAGAQADQPSG